MLITAVICFGGSADKEASINLHRILASYAEKLFLLNFGSFQPKH